MPTGSAGETTPRVAACLVRSGGGIDPPQFLAAVDVVGTDEATARPRTVRITTRAINHLAVDDHRPRGLGNSFVVVGTLRLPGDLAGAGVECDEERIVRSQNDFVTVDRNVPITIPRARHPSNVVRKWSSILPQEIPGRGVERLDDVLHIGEEHDAVVDNRLHLLIALVHRPRPDQLELVNAVDVDLVKGAVAPQRVAVPKADPVVSVRAAEHLRCDGNERFEEGGDDRLLS